MTGSPKIPEKIIFLDFDEVLSGHRVNLATGSMNDFDPIAVRTLNNICAVTGAKIVCTSVRADIREADAFREAMSLFRKAGMDLNHIHQDWTCRYDSGPREGHIHAWLQQHPGVTHHAIIDDADVALPNLVRVGADHVIVLKDIEKLAGFLDFDLLSVVRYAQEKELGNKPSLPEIKP